MEIKETKSYSVSPFDVLYDRWTPSEDAIEKYGCDSLLPPLVDNIRKAVNSWREQGYNDVSDTTRTLLLHWFKRSSDDENGFKYYFAQREAVETIIYLYEAVKVRDKIGLMGFDSTEKLKDSDFIEDWTRYVIKMATGSGKTKVVSLLIAWSFFHKHFETNSTLSKNTLLIAPNIIVLNRLKSDFENLKIYKEDPIIPDDWRNLFNPEVHVQDDIGQISGNGNIFLTNIHRVYISNKIESSDESWLGPVPKPNADRDSNVDLGKIIRSNEINDLIIFNDEAHHIHDEKLRWFQSIKEINGNLKMRQNKNISLQVDLTATPKHNNGTIFVQTICDYPLVEATRSNIVKQLTLPDSESRNILEVTKSDNAGIKYQNHLKVGVIEWRKHKQRLGKDKTPLLFIMTEDTRDAEHIAEHLESRYDEFKPIAGERKVLVIHTNKDGDFEKRDKTELETLRKAVDDVDSNKSPYLAVVSVMMLREGWNVRNVTTIVGLRPFSSKSNILPEQAVGRGLRKMYGFDVAEELVVVGTNPFLEFVETIKDEGVYINIGPIGAEEEDETSVPLIIELDRENIDKDLDQMNIELPVLSKKFVRDIKDISNINLDNLKYRTFKIQKYTPDEIKKLTFIDLMGEESHKIDFKTEPPDFENMIAFYTNSILKDARLTRADFSTLYPVVEEFVEKRVFGKHIDTKDPVVLINVGRAEVFDEVSKTFKKAIEELCLVELDVKQVSNKTISQMDFNRIAVSNQKYYRSKKSMHNIIVGNNYELEFARTIDEQVKDVISIVKLYERRSNFYLEYPNEDGGYSRYYPDFLIKSKKGVIYIAETKGIEDEPARRKKKRLEQWCNDANQLVGEKKYVSLYVHQKKWDKHKEYLKKMDELENLFGEEATSNE